MLEALDGGQTVLVDLVEGWEWAGGGGGIAVGAVGADVSKLIGVGVDAIQRGVRGVRLVEVAEQVVNEVREWLGGNHCVDPSMVQ